MENLALTIRNAQKKLDEIINNLNALEQEKKQIMLAYQNASDKEKIFIEKEMQESEKEYQQLSSDVKLFAEQIAKLKKRYENN